MTNYSAPVELINYMLENITYDPVLNNELDVSFFPGYEEEFEYIKNYYDKSKMLDGKGTVPTSIAFSVEFPEFPIYSPGSVIATILYDVREVKLFTLFRKTLEKAAEMTSEQDSVAAVEFAYQEIRELHRFANTSLGSGTDLIRGSKERLEDYMIRLEKHGLLGITTGDEEMDKQLHGWLPEDFIVIFARTNEGKSWLILYYLLNAWLAGNNIGFYAGEMNALMTGFRFDTLYKHFSNRGLISGDPNLGASEVGMKDNRMYASYVDELLAGESPSFRIFTQSDIGGEMTPDKMRVLQNKFRFDIWGLDQFTQMTDNKRTDIERIRYGNLSKELYSFSEEFQIPVIGVHQANRKAAERKQKNANASPELEEVFGADAIMQNATRGISWSQVENGAKAKVVKNRYGERNIEIYYNWNINYGILEPKQPDKLKDAFS